MIKIPNEERMAALSFYNFENYIADSMDRMFSSSKWERYVSKPMPPKEQGRNEKCNCSSGKKYKYCCGKRIESEGEK